MVSHLCASFVYGLSTFMEAQDDYFVNIFTPLYKILSFRKGKSII